MKKTFKQGQRVRIKSTRAAKKLLASVWLSEAEIEVALAGRAAKIVRLNDRKIGRPEVMCHWVNITGLDTCWVPPGALEAV